MYDVLVVGGGAAGLMAAASAVAGGANTAIIEKKHRPGIKLSITGKGRCNLTNVATVQQLVAHLPGNGRFLYSALARFGSHDTIRFFEGLGVPTKVERGGRVFPRSDRALDVVEALERYLRQCGVSIRLSSRVEALMVREGTAVGVVADGKPVSCRACVVATGGASYPTTGSTGDGYLLAREVGHTIVPVRPSLVPLESPTGWVPTLKGLSLRLVEAALEVETGDGRCELEREFGEMLFTHYGVSGPIILTLSRRAAEELRRGMAVTIAIDLKPALSPEQLDRRLQRDFGRYINRQFRNALDDLLPRSLIPVIVELSGVAPDRPVNQITREERTRLAGLLKRLEIPISNVRPLAEAIVTAGGVATSELEPRTMASRLVKGLYFAGEVVDVDGYTGGYNLQAAFAMGHVAGEAAADYSRSL